MQDEKQRIVGNWVFEPTNLWPITAQLVGTQILNMVDKRADLLTREFNLWTCWFSPDQNIVLSVL